MKRKSRLVSLLGSVGLALLLAGLVSLVLAAPVLIDNFDLGEDLYQRATTSCKSDSANHDSILGGQREFYVCRDSGTGGVAIAINEENSGLVAFSQDAGAEGWGRVVWDGQDNSGDDIDKTGLGGADLTDGGTNSGFQILIVSADGGFDLGIYVYSNTLTTYYTLTLPSAVSEPGESFFVPFSSLTGDDIFHSAGAIEFRIVSGAVDRDLRLDFFETSAETDWGDLPEAGTEVGGVARYYTTTQANGGPSHVRGDLYLGLSIDLEADGFPTTDATGDDGNNLDDEDGIERVKLEDGGTAWENGTGYITATVTGGTGDLYAWFDWNNDGDFDDANEAQSWTGLTAGEHRLSITVDGSFEADDDLFARFRLVSDGAGNPGYIGEVANGEVEDYFWDGWGPNAVTLSAIDAGPGLAGLPAFALVVAAVAGGAGLFIWKRRA